MDWNAIVVQCERELEDGGINSVRQQVHRLISMGILYRAMNDAVAQQNLPMPSLTRLVLEDFFLDVQSLRIRRLADSNWNAEGKAKPESKWVHSLANVLTTLANHHGLISRKALCDHRGYSLDPGKYREEWLSQFGGDKPIVGASPELVAEFHASFDLLCEKTPATRSPTDVLPRSLFESLRADLDGCSQKFKYWADKYAAHAATTSSRAERRVAGGGHAEVSFKVTHGELWECYAFVATLTNWVSAYLLNGSYMIWEDSLPLPKWYGLAEGQLPPSDLNHTVSLYKKYVEEVTSRTIPLSTWPVRRLRSFD